MRFRTKWIILLIPVLAVLLAAHTVAAREVIRGSECTIEADEVIEENVFVLCRTFTLNGHIEGNLIGAAFDIELNGPVDGNVYMLGGQMDVFDRLGRDLIFAGPALRVHPTTVFEDDRADVISASLSTEIYHGVNVPGSIISFSYQLLIFGDVSREISFWGSALHIEGSVSGDVDATVGDAQTGDASPLQTLLVPFRFNIRLIPPGLSISEGASIGGQLTYTSTAPGNIQGDLATPPLFDQVINTTDFSQLNDTDEESSITSWFMGYLGVVVREFVTLGAIGLLLAYMLPRPLQAPVQQIRARPLNSLGTGILTFILSIGLWVMLLLVIVLVILVFLALNLPDLTVVALVAIGVLNVGGASIFYFTAVYISRLIVCLALGRFVVRLTLGDNTGMIYLNMLVGVGLLSVLIFIPFAGSVINGLTLALGLGAIILSLNQLRSVQRRTAAPVRLPTAPEDARQIPPPVVEEVPRGPGMDNLPSGFRWWSDDEGRPEV